MFGFAFGVWLLLGQSGAALLRLPSRDALASLSVQTPAGPSSSDAMASTVAGPAGNQRAPSGGPYQLADAALVRQTLAHIQRLYLEVESLSPPALFVAGVEGMAGAAPDALWVPAQGDVPGALMVGRRVLLLTPDSFDTLASLGEGFARVFSFYLQSRELEVDEPLIEYAAVRGMLSLLDRPSQLLIDDRLDDFKTRSRGTLSGIGCRIGMRQDEPTVVKVIEKSPSETAGLLEGDRVVRIEGESTTNMSLNEVVSRLRGTAGTWVKLDVRRGDQQTLSFRILRDNIKIENVEAHKLPGNVGYVRITNFNDETLSNFRTRLDRIAPRGAGLKGLVIDLRQNGGGSLQQSAFMVDEFVPSGTIVRTVGKSGEKVNGLIPQFTAQEPQIMPGVPVAVLVDRRTASGSEILAGALKYLNRAILIGQRTYGKGSVQKLYPLNDHASLKLTIARYLLPGDHYIQSIGLQPDISLVPVIAEEDHINFRDDVERDDEEDGEDPSKPGKTPPVPREESAATVFYLDERGANTDLPPLERLWSDFEVRFAAQLLASVADGSRSGMLEQGRPYLERIKEEQSSALAAALKQRGIDWTVPTVGPGAQASVKLKLEPGTDGLKPGEKANLVLEVANNGTAPFSRLRAVSTSEDPMLDGLEFLFGRVEAGQTRSWPVSLSVPAGAAPGTRGVSFHFTAEGSRPPEPFESGLTILRGDSPYVEVEASYVDRAANGAAGNNNRVIEPGEEVAITLYVRNTGQAPTGQLSLSLRNPLRKDLELHSARVVLEPIAPGEQREATLSFELKTPAQGAEVSQARLNLVIVDRVHHIRLNRELDFGQPWSGRLQILPPRLQLTSVVPSGKVNERSYTIAGRVSDAQGIRDVTFYRGRQKVHRILPGLQAERPVTTLPFRADIPLSPGSNLLEVISQDEAGLISRQQLWISASTR